ncbi:hypothetical protein, partial [Arthrobacter sp. JCM 19049]|uniref:hypothetical protein n=1 Tax=Arthrobacter sp. JCM 19049 TaxID=1460643 RepID=UPI002436A955
MIRQQAGHRAAERGAAKEHHPLDPFPGHGQQQPVMGDQLGENRAFEDGSANSGSPRAWAKAGLRGRRHAQPTPRCVVPAGRR